MLVILIFDPESEELFEKICELFSFLNYNTMFIFIQQTKIPAKYCLPHYKQVRTHNKHTYNEGKLISASREEGQMFNLKLISWSEHAVFCQTKRVMNFCCL